MQEHDLLGARVILGNLSRSAGHDHTGGYTAAKSAEVLKYNFKVPCADAFASSLTYEPGCRTSQDQTTLVTTDLDFKEETHF
jgi:hypothetical protein